MNKTILTLVAVLALVGLLVPVVVFSAEGTVTCTVSAAAVVGVSVSPGNVTYGTLALQATKNTAKWDATYNPNGMNTSQTQTVTNTGNVNENFQIKTSHAIGTAQWYLVNLGPGGDEFTHAYNMQGTTPYNGGTAITFTKWLVADIYVSAGTTTAPTFHNYLELEIGMGNSFTDPGAHNITVTVLAVAA